VRFCIADGVGAIFGTSLIFLLGFGLGAVAQDFITALEDKILPYKSIILGVLLVGSAAYLLYLFLRKPLGPTGDPEEVPIIGHAIATHLPGVTTVKGEKQPEGSKSEAATASTGPGGPVK
jgi:hypothetical protein